jgi:hypothetical protein
MGHAPAFEQWIIKANPNTGTQADGNQDIRGSGNCYFGHTDPDASGHQSFTPNASKIFASDPGSGIRKKWPVIFTSQAKSLVSISRA